MPNSVNLPGCNNEICEFQRNSQITAELSFTARRASNKAFATVQVLLRGSWITLSRNEPICPKLVSGQCPLTADTRYTYRNNARVPDMVPVGLKTTAVIRAVDDQRGVIACVRIAARIVR